MMLICTPEQVREYERAMRALSCFSFALALSRFSFRVDVRRAHGHGHVFLKAASLGLRCYAKSLLVSAKGFARRFHEGMC